MTCLLLEQRDIISKEDFSRKRQRREKDKFLWELCTWMERIVFGDIIISRLRRGLSYDWGEKACGPGCWIPLRSASQPRLWVLLQQTLTLSYKEIGVVAPWRQHWATDAQEMILSVTWDTKTGRGNSYFLSKKDSNAEFSSVSVLESTHAEVKIWKMMLRAFSLVSGSRL